jgi:hypothetical protein
MNWPTACMTLSVCVASSLVGDSINACTLQNQCYPISNLSFKMILEQVFHVHDTALMHCRAKLVRVIETAGIRQQIYSQNSICY